MSGLETACVQALLTGSIAVGNVENHIDIDSQIVHQYPNVVYVIPDEKNTKKCSLSVSNIKKTKKVKKFIISD